MNHSSISVDEAGDTGTTDRLTVYVASAIAAGADPESGDADTTASMMGTIRLRQVAE